MQPMCVHLGQKQKREQLELIGIYSIDGRSNMINVKYINSMGNDLTVVNSARVSFDKRSTRLTKEDEKLISYLAKHKHMSPFGHCFATFLVSAPIFVARQLVKHKFLRWNEVSRRYVDKEPEFYIPNVWRERSANKKQGSSDDILNNLDGVVRYGLVDSKDVYQKRHRKGLRTIGTQHMVNLLNQKAYHLYVTMIEAGVCPEQARMILPQSTMTEWYWSGSLDAFADMCSLRLKEDAQYETREVAKKVANIMREFFPISWKELVK